MTVPASCKKRDPFWRLGIDVAALRMLLPIATLALLPAFKKPRPLAKGAWFNVVFRICRVALPPEVARLRMPPKRLAGLSSALSVLLSMSMLALPLSAQFKIPPSVTILITPPENAGFTIKVQPVIFILTRPWLPPQL